MRSAILTKGVAISRSNFTEAMLQGVRLLDGTRIVDGIFERVAMRDAVIKESVLNRASFVKAKLQRVRMIRSEVTDGVFRRCTLNHSHIFHVDSRAMTLKGVVLGEW